MVTPGPAVAVAVSGARAYVGCAAVYNAEPSLQVIDITNPGNPQTVGRVNTLGTPHEVIVSGGHVYLAEDRSGLQVFDIQSSDDPRVVGGVSTMAHAIGLGSSGAFVCVADTTGGLASLPSQCEPLPGEGGWNPLPLSGSGTESGDLASYANDYDPGSAGCTGRSAEGNDLVYSIGAEPGSVIELSYAQAAGDASVYLVANYQDLGSCVAASDTAGTGGEERLTYLVPAGRSTLYLILDGYGVGGGPFVLTYTIHPAAGIEDTGTGRPMLLTANPCHLDSPIRLWWPTWAARADVSLFDAQGSLVAVLFHGSLRSGMQELRWDGGSRGGFPIVSGIYFLRASAGRTLLSRKLVVIR
jgi:hypothetical protein